MPRSYAKYYRCDEMQSFDVLGASVAATVSEVLPYLGRCHHLATLLKLRNSRCVQHVSFVSYRHVLLCIVMVVVLNTLVEPIFLQSCSRMGDQKGQP